MDDQINFFLPGLIEDVIKIIKKIETTSDFSAFARNRKIKTQMGIAKKENFYGGHNQYGRKLQV